MTAAMLVDRVDPDVAGPALRRDRRDGDLVDDALAIGVDAGQRIRVGHHRQTPDIASLDGPTRVDDRSLRQLDQHVSPDRGEATPLGDHVPPSAARPGHGGIDDQRGERVERGHDRAARISGEIDQQPCLLGARRTAGLDPPGAPRRLRIVVTTGDRGDRRDHAIEARAGLVGGDAEPNVLVLGRGDPCDRPHLRVRDRSVGERLAQTWQRLERSSDPHALAGRVERVAALPRQPMRGRLAAPAGPPLAAVVAPQPSQQGCFAGGEGAGQVEDLGLDPLQRHVVDRLGASRCGCRLDRHHSRLRSLMT